ncbi:MAG: hypothetical protein EXS12_04185 [Phycisphaerales bacterium]|nr:hypothetical protein [Phycisphaerales bacterium]
MSRFELFLILLVFAAVSWTSAHAQGVVEPPLPWKVKLITGEALKGTISKWDFAGIEGSFGQAPWSNFKPDDANRLCRKLMDWKQGSQYIQLARMLFTLQGADKLAEAAIRDAIRRDRALAPEVVALRAEVAESRRKVIEDRRMAAEKDFQAKTVGANAPTKKDPAPSAKPASVATDAQPKSVAPDAPPAQPWSVATDAQRAEALTAMKADADLWLKQVNLRYSIVEAKYWVLYADLPLAETKDLAQRMDDMYETVAKMFALPVGLNIFHGKAVVIISATEAHYRAIEMAAFNSMPPPGAIGLCHMVGPKVVVSAYKCEDANRFMATLVHEASHGFMHRYGSPARLPSWADEGYAEYVAAESFPNSTTKGDRKPQGLQWIRSGTNNVATVLEMNYENGSWPGDNAIGYAIGYLTVDLLMQTNRVGFGEWVKDVKSGIPWEEALVKRFGWNSAQLGRVVKSRYRARD